MGVADSSAGQVLTLLSIRSPVQLSQGHELMVPAVQRELHPGIVDAIDRVEDVGTRAGQGQVTPAVGLLALEYTGKALARSVATSQPQVQVVSPDL